MREIFFMTQIKNNSLNKINQEVSTYHNRFKYRSVIAHDEFILLFVIHQLNSCFPFLQADDILKTKLAFRTFILENHYTPAEYQVAPD